ncbi:hypothetical protein ASE16_12520 [Leifsonia sp. Root227]|uniref:hypothetical protein n=1 Tax=unclassified Leifsonia TaxID=2663824 RepID=UPI0006F713C2|nr:hypothetical protein [Leifsonia sp. Root227]KRC49546.1 hypothetical protein ASE16_12520 [Leifsonia sp. Root227]
MDTQSQHEKSEDPRSRLDIIDDQQRRVDRDFERPVVWLYAVWGFAWLIGYLVLWLATGPLSGTIPGPLAGIVFAVLIVGSIVASALIGSRIGRGMRGPSTFSGIVYGVSWSACAIAFAALGIGLVVNGLSDDLSSLYFPSAYALMCGALYLGGAAIWQDRIQLVIGVVLLALGGAAPFAGVPWNLLVMAVVGGGAFLVGAAVTVARVRK